MTDTEALAREVIALVEKGERMTLADVERWRELSTRSDTIAHDYLAKSEANARHQKALALICMKINDRSTTLEGINKIALSALYPDRPTPTSKD